MDDGNIVTKFYDTDKIYLEERQKLSQKYGKQDLWDVIDPWGLAVGFSNLSIKLSIIDYLTFVFQRSYLLNYLYLIYYVLL